MFPSRPFARAGFLIFCCFAATPARAAEAPYFEDFDVSPPNGVPANFVEAPDSAWTLEPGFYDGGVVNSGGTTVASSSISLTNVAGHNFTVKTSFRVFSSGAFDFRLADVGLVVLADNADVTTGGYLLRWESAGLNDVHNKLFLTGHAVGSAGNKTIGAPRGERLFTMTLRGVYVNGSLHLTGTLGIGLNKAFVEVTDPTPLTGTYFGFRLSAGVGRPHVSSISANIDDFSVTLDP